MRKRYGKFLLALMLALTLLTAAGCDIQVPSTPTAPVNPGTEQTDPQDKPDTPESPEEPEEPTTKVCPFCQSEIAIKAVRCPHCTSKLEGFPEINN